VLRQKGPVQSITQGTITAGRPGVSVGFGDYFRQAFRGPAEQLTPAELRHRQRAHAVARQLLWALAPHALLRVLRERAQPVAPLEHRQIALRRLDALEATVVVEVGLELLHLGKPLLDQPVVFGRRVSAESWKRSRSTRRAVRRPRRRNAPVLGAAGLAVAVPTLRRAQKVIDKKQSR
jgi:hypothetical protein